MANLEDIPELNDLEKSIKESSVKGSLGLNSRIISISGEAEYQHHSIIGKVNLCLSGGDEKKIFFKKHVASVPTESSPSSRPPDMLHRRELAVLDIFSQFHQEVRQYLTPKLLGHITKLEEGTFYLFTSYLNGGNDRKKLLDIVRGIVESDEQGNHQKRKKLEEDRHKVIHGGLKQIARFNGVSRAYENRFDQAFNRFGWNRFYEKKQGDQEKRMFEYLLGLIHHWELGGKEGEKFNQRETEQYVRGNKKVDLRKRIGEIFELRRAIRTEKRLQHCDCRTHHNYEGVFIDLESFGPFEWNHDLALYTSEDFSALDTTSLPSDLAYYMAYEIAYASRSRSLTIGAIEDLDPNDPSYVQKLLQSKHISTTDFADFVVGYINGLLGERDIIKEGINRKYSEIRLRSLYPEYLVEKILNSRMGHIAEAYHFLTYRDLPSLFHHCTNSKGVRTYFFELGKLLQDELELVQIDDDKGDKLSSLVNGSQWDLFFPKPSPAAKSPALKNYKKQEIKI